MLELIVAAASVDSLIDMLRGLIMPVVLIVVGLMAIFSAIKGNIIQLLTLIGVFIVALIIFLNPNIVAGLGGDIGTEVCESIEGC